MKTIGGAGVLIGIVLAASCVPEGQLHRDGDPGDGGRAGAISFPPAGAATNGGTRPAVGEGGDSDGGLPSTDGGVAENGGARGDGGGSPIGAAGADEPASGFATLKFCNTSVPDDGTTRTIQAVQGDTVVTELSAKPGECAPAAGAPCASIPSGQVTFWEVKDAGPEPLPFLSGREGWEAFPGDSQMLALNYVHNQLAGSIFGPFSGPAFCASASYASLFPPGCGRGGPVRGPPSCSCLPADTCGKEDCCSTNLFSGGQFYRSNDLDTPATVSPFRLDKFEISVARFRNFLAHYTAPAPGSGKNDNDNSDSGWDPAWSAQLPPNADALRTAFACNSALQTWTDKPAENEGLPINCLTWYEAQAFCIWDGGRLPTEAEWNFVAANGSDQRLYPWSNPPSNLNISPDYANYAPSQMILLVGSKRLGASASGQLDLAGNVAEWVEDWFTNPYPGPCRDCGSSASKTERSVRGGSFEDAAIAIATSARSSAVPTQRSAKIGARCARAAVP